MCRVLRKTHPRRMVFRMEESFKVPGIRVLGGYPGQFFLWPNRETETGTGEGCVLGNTGPQWQDLEFNPKYADFQALSLTPLRGCVQSTPPPLCPHTPTTQTQPSGFMHCNLGFLLSQGVGGFLTHPFVFLLHQAGSRSLALIPKHRPPPPPQCPLV